MGQHSTTRHIVSCQQWQQVRFPPANLETFIGIISPVMKLHGCQKQSGKADQPVETVNCRHLAWGNKITFNLCATMLAFIQTVVTYYVFWVKSFGSVLVCSYIYTNMHMTCANNVITSSDTYIRMYVWIRFKYVEFCVCKVAMLVYWRCHYHCYKDCLQ